MLNVPRSTFFWLVKEGQIREQEGRGKRDGRYSMEDIRRIAQERSIKHHKTRHRSLRPIPTIEDWLSPNDIPAILRLDQLVYHEMYLAEMERYRQWSEKNGQLAYACFDAKSDRQIMLAYIACLPLPEEVILQVMRGEREEISITQEEIRSYEEKGPYVLLANSAVVHPSHPFLLVRILKGMIEAWVDRFPERYITRVYAQSVSERGDLLISSFFMQPRYDLANNAFMLDLCRPARAKLIRRFQEALQAKDPAQYAAIYQRGVNP